MILQQNNCHVFCAVSYETVTFCDLKFFLSESKNRLHRIDPESFMAGQRIIGACNYINLLMKDMHHRQQICEIFDEDNLDRFSFVHDRSTVSGARMELGSFVYPLVSIYLNAKIGPDVVVHSQCAFGHSVEIGRGSFFSGAVTVGGSTKIGHYCSFGLAATVYDRIHTTSHCYFGARTIIRKNVNVSGKYGWAKTNCLLRLR